MSTIAAHDEVLAWVNEVREDLGWPLLEGLPKGLPKRARSCPVALALTRGCTIAAALSSVVVVDERWIDLPGGVSRWIREFDRGAFPEMVIEWARGFK